MRQSKLRFVATKAATKAGRKDHPGRTKIAVSDRHPYAAIAKEPNPPGIENVPRLAGGSRLVSPQCSAAGLLGHPVARRHNYQQHASNDDVLCERDQPDIDCRSCAAATHGERRLLSLDSGKCCTDHDARQGAAKEVLARQPLGIVEQLLRSAVRDCAAFRSSHAWARKLTLCCGCVARVYR